MTRCNKRRDRQLRRRVKYGVEQRTNFLVASRSYQANIGVLERCAEKIKSVRGVTRRWRRSKTRSRTALEQSKHVEIRRGHPLTRAPEGNAISHLTRAILCFSVP